MGNKSFIFITDSKFNERDYFRFGCDTFLKYGYNIKVLVVSKYTNPEVEQNSWIYYKNNDINVEICDSLNSIKKYLNLYGKEDICLLNTSFNTKQGILILAYLKYKNIYSIKIAAGLIPKWQKNIEYYNKNTMINKIQYLIEKFKRNNTVYKFFFRIQDRLYKYIYRNLTADLFLTSNYKTYSEVYGKPNVDDVFEIHNLDYDNYLRIQQKTTILESTKYVVFLDQYLLYHDDFTRMGVNNTFTKEYYFSELNKLFHLIEKEYKFNVVIAAHPRADKKEYSSFFNNRNVYFGKTIELIKDSEFVLLHYSASINYAILLKKQLLFITNKELKDNFSIGDRIEQFSDLTGQKIIDTDLLENQSCSLNIIDKNKYNAYKNKYIKLDSSKNDYFWEVFFTKYKSKDE